MDSTPPKKHGAEWWALLFTIAVALASGATGYGILRERVDTLTEQERLLDKRIGDMERDKSLADKLEDVRVQLVRVESQVGSVSADVKELKDKKR